ncbi:uncharacterized protein IUM83_00913 [Phytophthora cinnamomi]|uniref:uncharacterized protein n=1 Tax=Phytophthora cinnamomi TaxID=4785 RepID=UPI00355A1E43|nr:hypothetical protein IUM83_00913 [Phytophthora cinnamomi]
MPRQIRFATGFTPWLCARSRPIAVGHLCRGPPFAARTPERASGYLYPASACHNACLPVQAQVTPRCCYCCSWRARKNQPRPVGP